MSDSSPRGRARTPLSGALAEGAIPALLREIYLGRKTGLLSFVKGWERRSVRFISGNIVHADTNAPGGHLGDLMVRHGLLQREDLSRALAETRRSGKRLGFVLAEAGLLDKELLDDAVLLHVADTLVKVFCWQEGAYDFEEQDAAAFKAYDLTLNASTGDLILHAVRGIEDPDVVRYCLGDLDRVLTLSTDPLLRFQRLKLGPTDAFILSRVDGSITARGILEIAPVAAEDAMRPLFGLLCVGLVEYAVVAAPAEAPAPETLREEVLAAHRHGNTGDHFEVLGVGREASEAEVRAAYLRLARRLHPDIQHDPVLADLKAEIEAVFTRLSEAYHVLGDPRRRAAYECTLLVNALREQAQPEPPPEPPPAQDPLAEQQRADELLAAAEALFAGGRYWDALRQCEDLLPLARGKTRRRARVLLAECYLKNPNWRKQAEEELQGAIQEDPDNADACFRLGVIYKQGGLRARALAMFRRTLELRPRHAGAAEELASLQGEGGFLRKFRS